MDHRTGRSTFIGFKEVVVRAADGRIDKMTDLGNGQVRVEGWAHDPTRPGRPSTVRLRVDGQVHVITANVDRPDVVRAIPGAFVRCGFSHVISLRPGTRTVCADVQLSDGSFHHFRCRGALLLAAPMGRLDSAVDQGDGRVRVRGWAIVPPLQTAAAQIQLRVDGTVVETLEASAPRPDVAQVYPGYGPDHGFDTVIDVPPGTHQICVDAVHDGVVTPLRCRTATVQG